MMVCLKRISDPNLEPRSNASYCPCCVPDHTHPPGRQPRSRRHHLVLMATKTLAILLLLTSIFLASYYYRNSLTSSNPRGDDLGSGIILDLKSHAATGQHFLDEPPELVVQLAGEPMAMAGAAGQDPISDLAVLRLDMPGEKLTVVFSSDSDALCAGQGAIVIGRPFGLNEAPVGQVSGLGQASPVEDKYAAATGGTVRTGAAIKPGHSQAALFNLVIGWWPFTPRSSAPVRVSRGWASPCQAAQPAG